GQETYLEAALRELEEELSLLRNWRLGSAEVRARLGGALERRGLFANQLPSSAGNNNEWVMAYRLDWPRAFGEPTAFHLDEEEGVSHATWGSFDELVALATAAPARCASSLRLCLLRR